MMDFEAWSTESIDAFKQHTETPPAAIRVWRCEHCGASGWIVRSGISAMYGISDLETSYRKHRESGVCDYSPELTDGFE